MAQTEGQGTQWRGPPDGTFTVVGLSSTESSEDLQRAVQGLAKGAGEVGYHDLELAASPRPPQPSQPSHSAPSIAAPTWPWERALPPILNTVVAATAIGTGTGMLHFYTWRARATTLQGRDMFGSELDGGLGVWRVLPAVVAPTSVAFGALAIGTILLGAARGTLEALRGGVLHSRSCVRHAGLAHVWALLHLGACLWCVALAVSLAVWLSGNVLVGTGAVSEPGAMELRAGPRSPDARMQFRADLAGARDLARHAWHGELVPALAGVALALLGHLWALATLSRHAAHTTSERRPSRHRPLAVAPSPSSPSSTEVHLQMAAYTAAAAPAVAGTPSRGPGDLQAPGAWAPFRPPPAPQHQQQPHHPRKLSKRQQRQCEQQQLQLQLQQQQRWQGGEDAALPAGGPAASAEDFTFQLPEAPSSLSPRGSAAAGPAARPQ